RQVLLAHDPPTPGPAASALSGPALSWNPHELTLRRPLAARRLPPPRRGVGVGDPADPRRVPDGTARRAGTGRGARARGGAPAARGAAVRAGASPRRGTARRARAAAAAGGGRAGAAPRRPTRPLRPGRWARRPGGADRRTEPGPARGRRAPR